jgi:hypothetical protein
MNTRRSLRALALCLGAALLMGALACAGPPKQYDTNSGGDENRKTARKLFPGQNVTDSLDDPGGDHTDWKEVRIRENGRLGVTVALDDIRGVDGYISIKDGFGVELERRPISSSDNLYNFDKLPVYQGEYYIQVFLETGKTTYTVGAIFDPDNKGGAVVAVPIDDNPDPGGRRNNTGGTSGGVAVKSDKGGQSGTSGEVTPPPDDKTVIAPPDVGKPSEEDDANFTSLRGRIARIVPLEDGGTQLIISGFGASDGVTAGMSGVIVGLGQSFRVTQVRATGATALTSANAEDLGPYKTVLLKVKRQ